MSHERGTKERIFILVFSFIIHGSAFIPSVSLHVSVSLWQSFVLRFQSSRFNNIPFGSSASLP